jgi:formylglycine-generating enzyme required for sulfatase activity
MAGYPVLVSQYAAFVAAGGYDQQRWWSVDGWAWRQGRAMAWGRAERGQPRDWVNQIPRPTYPVTGVTWYEAEAYCSWVGTQKNQAVRLPTEEEWEKAARGVDGRTWPWGETFNAKRTNTYEHGVVGTLPAGHVKGDVSPYGLVDMGGNVQEWTSSLYRPQPDEALPAAELRVARGGSWNDTAFGSRTSFRHVYPPGYYFPFLGFRIVVEKL